MRILCYCTQINLPVQLEIESQFLILAFVGKQAGSLIWFPRVALENSAGSLRCRVTSPGSWNLGFNGFSFSFFSDCLMLILRWDGSVVTLLVRRRYGVYTVFDSRGSYLSQQVLRRDSSGPSFRRWRARKSYKRGSRDSRERARTQRVVLNCPGLDIAHRRLVQSERRYGAEPRLHGCSCKALSCDEK